MTQVSDGWLRTGYARHYSTSYLLAMVQRLGSKVRWHKSDERGASWRGKPWTTSKNRKE